MGHSHSHALDDGEPVTTPKVQRILTATVVALAVLALVGIVVLRPRGDAPPIGPELGFAVDRVDADVTEIDVDPCQGTTPDDGILCQRISFDVTSGTTKGEASYFELPISSNGPDIDAGEGLVLGYEPTAATGLQYFFLDVQRKTPMMLLAAMFVVAVIALGRFQGIRALAALALTGVVVIAFLLPALLEGRSPLGVALVAAAVIALAALYLSHGVNERTTVALLGTFASLAVTGMLAAFFVGATRLSGLASEDALLLQVAGGGIDLRGLVLAGIVIGSLGVLDDVTVTQVSAVWELHQANPDYGVRSLYAAATRIGRDHIASTVNTLVLAYAGASLPLLLIYTQAGLPLSAAVTGEVLAVEVVRTLVGSIGLVASVPITTALASVVVTQSHERIAGRARPAVEDVAPEPLAASWDDFAPGE